MFWWYLGYTIGLWYFGCHAYALVLSHRLTDAFNVAFLPNASQSLRVAQHPDERLGDRKFTHKYWDQLIEPYNISHEIPNEEELDQTDEET
ncbi:hypothetical protein O181_130418 [Austropuccinia psidii MF-1]|uniref:Uncharacterized protein n=1 Tax=Austropuccinia psidii MF-1 TaxID=1389203 RepID=A0A9Q3Q9S6_9BASI|nr:hypothetical protein [Austropuccinia psidii MF-1]